MKIVLVVCWSGCLVAGAAATQGEEVDDVRHHSIRGHSSVSSRCERWVASRGYHTHAFSSNYYVCRFEYTGGSGRPPHSKWP